MSIFSYIKLLFNSLTSLLHLLSPRKIYGQAISKGSEKTFSSSFLLKPALFLSHLPVPLFSDMILLVIHPL